MMAANILAICALLIWIGLLWLGRALIASVAAQKVLGYPNIDQIDHLIITPALCIVAISIIAYASNVRKIKPDFLAVVSLIGIAGSFVYFITLGGGV